MTTKLAMWLQGNGVQPEFPPITQLRMAGSAWFTGIDQSFNWFHFPISAPVVYDGTLTRLERVFVLYRMQFAAVEAVHVWSGSSRLAVFNVIQEAGSPRTNPDVDRNAFLAGKTQFDLVPAFPAPMETPRGLSVSVKVRFDSRGEFEVRRDLGKIEFFAAGADWAMP